MKPSSTPSRLSRPVIVAFALVLSIHTAATVVAQDMPQPAPQLAQLEPLLGNWSGSGVYRMSAGAPDMKWTSTSTTQRILDGHFVQEDMLLSVEIPDFPGMAFRTIYSWSASEGCFRAFLTNSMGQLDRSRAYWHDNKLVSISYGLDDAGAPFVDRSVSTFSADTMTFNVERSSGGDPFFVLLEGKLTRGGEGHDITQHQIPSMVPALKMEPFKGQVGTWVMTGSMSPMPGMQAIPISGKQETRALLGGHLQFSEIVGDPMPGTDLRYKGNILMAWDKTAKIYVTLDLGSFGECIEYETRVASPKSWISTGSADVYGTHQQIRNIITQKSDDEVHLKSTRLVATMPEEVCFEAVVKREK